MTRNRLVKSVAVGLAVTAALAFTLYRANAAPAVARLSDTEIATDARPYIVKLHAQWCPVCLVTTGVWEQVQSDYAARARLVVFDFTNAATTDRSRAEAHRLKLDNVFEEYAGVTGTVLVVDGRTGAVTADLHGDRDFGNYQRAIAPLIAERPGER